MNSFLQELAQARPDPGGGAAAAYGANLGLALLEKVVRLEGQRRQKPAGEARRTWEEALAQLRRLAENLEKLQEEDVQAYFNLVAARTSGDAARLAAAVREAVDLPAADHGASGKIPGTVGLGRGTLQKTPGLRSFGGRRISGGGAAGAYHIAGANLPLVPKRLDRQTLARRARPGLPGGRGLISAGEGGPGGQGGWP